MGWGELLNGALEEVVPVLITMETEYDAEKLTKKLREYFNKGTKSMSFKKQGLEYYVNEYVDNALGSVFAGLGDREWLYTGQGDLSPLVSAAIRDYFPKWLMKDVNEVDLETYIAAAYERAFEEQRFGPILSEAVPDVVVGPKIKRKVWNACDEGRKAAVKSGVLDVEEFTKTWINTTIKELSENSLGNPELTLPQDNCVKLFVKLLEGGALPLTLQAGTPAPPLAAVEPAVAEGYTQHTIPEGAPVPLPKKQKKSWSNDDWSASDKKSSWGGGAAAGFGKGAWGGGACWGKGGCGPFGGKGAFGGFGGFGGGWSGW